MNVANEFNERKVSEVDELSKPTNVASQKENEIPSQSDTFQKDEYNSNSNPKNIVSFVPDSTNE